MGYVSLGSYRASDLFDMKLLLMLLVLAVCTPDSQGTSPFAEEEKLIGWRGDTYVLPDSPSPQDDVKAPDVRAPDVKAPNSTRRPWIETISWAPRAFVYHNFLSREECEHLKKIATPRLSRSMVVPAGGGEAVDPIRTSYSASLSWGEDPVVEAIENRIAEWTHLPKSYGEPIEVLRYNNKQKYDAHWDWFDNAEIATQSTLPGSNRMATVLMYLSDVADEDGAGGETALPLAVPLDEEVQSLDRFSPCASQMGLAIKPVMGDTLLFWDMLPDGARTDRRALHAACPIFKGTKWTATKWIHNKSERLDEQ